MRNYRDNWFNVGGVLAMVIAGIMALSHRGTSRLRLFSALNFAALLVHQFEEYSLPGYFPGQLNAGIFKSEKPDRYPLNTNSALIVNTANAYPFYLLPVLFPKRRWLGLAPVIFGFGQAVFHGIVPPLRAKASRDSGSSSISAHVSAMRLRSSACSSEIGGGGGTRRPCSSSSTASPYLRSRAACGGRQCRPRPP